jgi:hypothetical protein
VAVVAAVDLAVTMIVKALIVVMVWAVAVALVFQAAMLELLSDLRSNLPLPLDQQMLAAVAQEQLMVAINPSEAVETAVI